METLAKWKARSKKRKVESRNQEQMSMEFELEKVGSWHDKILHDVLLKIEP